MGDRPLHSRSLEVICVLRHRLGDRNVAIGAGGIMSASDALATIRNGAELVQIYAGLVYRGPKLVREIVDGIG